MGWGNDAVLDLAFRIPHDRPPRGLLVLTAYVDETGQEQGDWMFIAGYMGSDDAWRSFPEPWQKAISPRKHLHMNRLKFKSPADRKMLALAANVPTQCGLIPLIAGLRQNDYRELLTGTKQERTLSGYVLGCMAVAAIALSSLPPGERLEIVMERQDRYGWLADVALQVIFDYKGDKSLLLADGTPKLANWRFVSKDQTVLTEAADYLAYAYLQVSRDSKSIRSQWCAPILDAQGPHTQLCLLLPTQVREMINQWKVVHLIEEAKRKIHKEN